MAAKGSAALVTPRELEVVKLMAQGHCDESVANQLNISQETVKRHNTNFRTKLNINNSREAIAWYYRTYWQPKELASEKVSSL